MDLNIDSIVGKIESNADKLGLAVGAYGELNRFAKEWAAQGYPITDPISAALNIVQALIDNPHLPNLAHVKDSLLNSAGTFKPAVMAAIAGYFLKEVDVMPKLTRLGNALMKAGVGAAEAAAIINVITYSGAASSPLALSKAPSNQNGSGVPIGTRSVSLATSYKEIPIGGAF